MPWLTKFIDLLFYGNFWIAACAAAMVLQSQLFFTRQLTFDPLVCLVFFATLFLYAIHRTIGLQKVEKFTNKGRYFVIARFKNHIQFYAIVGALGAAIGFFFVSWKVQLALIIPALISLGYVLPFLSGKRRLRDLNHIKIYLVAIVWAWITVVLPALEYRIIDVTITYKSLIFMALERVLFIFAITIPFDVRDLKIDEHTGVKTLPAQLGASRAKGLAIAALLLMLVLVFNNPFYATLPLGLLLSAIITAIIVWFSDRVSHDYYFTGAVDGMMLLQFILILFFHN